MPLQADNPNGAGKRLVADSHVTDGDLGVPASSLPSSGVNAFRVRHVDVQKVASFNQDDNDIEKNETTGNTLFKAKVSATLVGGEVTGTSDEQEDFKGDLGEGYAIQKLEADYDDYTIDASDLFAGQAGTLNVLDVLEETTLALFKNAGIQDQGNPSGTRSTLTGTVGDTPEP